MEILNQVVILFALIIGIITGEYLSSRAFGRIKSLKEIIMELLIFVVALVMLSEFIRIAKGQIFIQSGVNFLIGLTAALVSVGAVTGLGYLGKVPRIVLKKPSKEDKLLLNSARALFSKGLSKKEVISTLKESGYKEKKVKKMIRANNLKRKPNPLTDKIAKLESEIEELRERN